MCHHERCIIRQCNDTSPYRLHARIEGFLSGGMGEGVPGPNGRKKVLTTFFGSQLILQRSSNGLFQGKPNFFKVPGESNIFQVGPTFSSGVCVWGSNC